VGGWGIAWIGVKPSGNWGWLGNGVKGGPQGWREKRLAVVSLQLLSRIRPKPTAGPSRIKPQPYSNRRPCIQPTLYTTRAKYQYAWEQLFDSYSQHQHQHQHTHAAAAKTVEDASSLNGAGAPAAGGVGGAQSAGGGSETAGRGQAAGDLLGAPV